MIFDRYIFKDLSIATLFVALVLAMIILLTESLKFLELIINAGASSASFWILTALAMPRFFEIILPIAAMASTLFVYNRMTMDSELVVMRATGFSPFKLSRPAIAMALSTTIMLYVITIWISPWSLSHMEKLRSEIKTQFSTLLFREGVFNPVGVGLTIYIRDRDMTGELHGLMIYDSRKTNRTPVTIVARRGELVMGDKNQQVVVYDGTRQQIDPDNGNLNRLDFDRYTIDLPDGSGTVADRWREPEERSFHELLRPAPEDIKNRKTRHEFRVEIQRRLLTPLLCPLFTILSLVLLLIGPVDRRGQGKRIAFAVLCATVIEGLYLSSINMARHSNAGMIMMYLLIALPLFMALYCLHPHSEGLRQRWLYGRRDDISATSPAEQDELS